MDPVDTHKHIRRLHIYILILTLSVFAMVWLLFKDQLPGAKKEAPKPVSVKIKENRGVMALQTKNNSNLTSIGSPVVVQVLADSDNEDIVAFDVLLGFDKAGFEVTSVVTPLAGFKALSTNGDNYIAVTGYQDLPATSRNYLKNNVILEVTLTPKVAGEYLLTILPTADKLSSQLVNTKNVVLLPEVENLKVNVQ